MSARSAAHAAYRARQQRSVEQARRDRVERVTERLERSGRATLRAGELFEEIGYGAGEDPCGIDDLDGLLRSVSPGDCDGLFGAARAAFRGEGS